jgi:hypothetical protein
LTAIKEVRLFAKASGTVDVYESIDDGDPIGSLDANLGNLIMGKLNKLPESPIGKYTLYLSNNAMEELWLAVTWGKDE